MFQLVHIGINPNNAAAEEIAASFCNLFDLPFKAGKSSTFAGKIIEVMHEDYLGTNGHIALGTESIEAAMTELTKRGAQFDMSTAKYNDDGTLKAVYLKGEIGGFAIHLLKV